MSPADVVPSDINIRRVRTQSCGVQVGNQPLSLPEQRAHFALWALMKSPLLIGTDLLKASQQVSYPCSRH